MSVLVSSPLGRTPPAIPWSANHSRFHQLVWQESMNSLVPDFWCNPFAILQFETETRRVHCDFAMNNFVGTGRSGHKAEHNGTLVWVLWDSSGGSKQYCLEVWVQLASSAPTVCITFESPPPATRAAPLGMLRVKSREWIHVQMMPILVANHGFLCRTHNATNQCLHPSILYL